MASGFSFNFSTLAASSSAQSQSQSQQGFSFSQTPASSSPSPFSFSSSTSPFASSASSLFSSSSSSPSPATAFSFGIPSSSSVSTPLSGSSNPSFSLPSSSAASATNIFSPSAAAASAPKPFSFSFASSPAATTTAVVSLTSSAVPSSTPSPVHRPDCLAPSPSPELAVSSAEARRLLHRSSPSPPPSAGLLRRPWLAASAFLCSAALRSRYEALVFSKGKTETKGFQSNSSTNGIKLQLPERLKGSYWFTKFTLARFLHVVNSAEMLKSANTIENEMSQLEDTRRFHLAIYAKEHPDHSAGAIIAPSPPSGPTVKKIADKLASFVAKVGTRFEDITRQRNPGDTPFNSSNETLSTLKFAQRARLIQNNAVVNEDSSGDIVARNNVTVNYVGFDIINQ